MSEALAAMGGLPGLAAFITSLATLWTALKVKKDTKELKPNHGSSMADKLARVELKVDSNSEILRSHGHQLGEIRRDMADDRHDRQDLASRVRRLEAK